MANLSYHMGYAMTGLGFSGKSKEWAGKTIKAIENVPGEFGASFDEVVLFLFDDGTRGWMVGRSSCDGIVTGPRPSSLEKSAIVTAEEYGWIMQAQKQESDRREADRILDKERQLERLKKELGK